MIAFQTPTLADRAWAEPLFYAAGNRGCENNFVNLFVWKSVYHQQIARLHNCVLIRYATQKAKYYLYPAGPGDVRACVAALLDDAAAQGEPLRLIGVTPEQTQNLTAWFPGMFTYEADRDGFDYLYEVDRLADLKGRKLQAKRNHINRFCDHYPTWRVEILTPENLPACREIERHWQQQKEKADSPIGEDAVIASALDNFTALGLEGLMIVTEDGPLAFTLGRRMTEDTYDVHFEKADGEIQGSYAIVNREFARWVRSQYPAVRYLNREDDMGLPGLRKAKESYVPDCMVEKHVATWEGTRG